jgi:hypothetical protein
MRTRCASATPPPISVGIRVIALAGFIPDVRRLGLYLALTTPAHSIAP